MLVGRVSELWRYPVKSMRGERLPRTAVELTYGIPGDRGWAIRDERVGEVRGAKKIGGLLRFAARYLSEPEGAVTPPIEIDLDDGTVVRSDDPNVSELLSSRLEIPVTLWSRQPAENLDFYRRVEAIDDEELRRQLGLLPDEPLPDYSLTTPAELLSELAEYVAPLGTYFDGLELHLLTNESIAALAERAPDSDLDVRRFRPNILVETCDPSGRFIEQEWCGRTLLIGNVIAEVTIPMSRCVMVTLPQGDLARDRSIMRTLVQETGMNLGVGLTVVRPGAIEVGDAVELIE